MYTRKLRDFMTEVKEISGSFAVLRTIKNNQSLELNPLEKSSIFLTKKPVNSEPKIDVARVKTVADVSAATGLSKDFINLIIDNETLQLKEYKVNGVRTIGFGHNIDADKNYKLGHKITEQQAYALLAKDLEVKQRELNVLVGNAKLKPWQKEALIDLLFNVGYGKLAKSDLIAKIKAGKIDEAVSEFNYVLLDGKANPSLCKRRIQNMYHYSKHNPSKRVSDSMEEVKNNGLVHYENKMKTATQKERLDIERGKNLYLQECNLVINVVKYRLAKSESITNDEKGILEKIKSWFFD